MYPIPEIGVYASKGLSSAAAMIRLILLPKGATMLGRHIESVADDMQSFVALS